MKTFIALFRGINVGGKNIVPMKDLVDILGDQGFENIRTYIQSGNVIFDSKKTPIIDLGTLIEQHFGFQPTVVVLTRNALEEAVRKNPYHPEEGKQCHFYFSDESLKNKNTSKLSELKDDSESFTIVGKVLYLYAPNGIGRSKLAAKVERLLNAAVTARNLNTVTKLLEMSHK